MYICLCHAVSNVTIATAIDAGARTVEAVGESCGAGTVCGKCRKTIEIMLSGQAKPSSLARLPGSRRGRLM